MAIQFQHVRPGDVITATLINQIIDKLIELEGGIGSSGSTGGTSIITRFNPATAQAAGQVLTIFGTFDFPLALNAIAIDSIQIPTTSFITGSDASQISFLIPTGLAPISDVPSRSVTVRVRRTSNGQEGQKEYSILPQVQSAVPDPIFNPHTTASPNPSNLTNPSFAGTLRIGDKARILGQHLSPNPTVTIRFQTALGTFDVYPDPAAVPPHPGPVLDTANSNESQLVFTVPVIGGLTLGVPGAIIVEARIPGAVNKATIGATVMRVT